MCLESLPGGQGYVRNCGEVPTRTSGGKVINVTTRKDGDHEQETSRSQKL